MNNSSVFWNMFIKTGMVGCYLLHKHCEKDLNSEQTTDENSELCEAASERG